MKIQKISNLVLLACIVIIILCFGAFLSIGYDNMVGDNNEPMLTDVIMWLMYALVAATAGLTIWSVISGAQSNKGNDPAATTGVPGGKITLGTIAITLISLTAGYALGIGEADFTASDGTVTEGSWISVVDMFMTSMGVLFVVAAAAVALSMSGFATKSASK